jgi:multiple sugar transport system permease protein
MGGRGMGRKVIYIVAAALISFIGINIFPFLWLVITSFKTRADTLTTVPKLFFEPTFSNYISAFAERGFTVYLVNSLIIALGTTALTILLAFPAAYVFSRIKLKGDNHMFFVILTTRMGPGVLVAVPIFLMFSSVGLWDTHFVVILLHTAFNLAFAIWLIKGFIDDVPRDLDEAAWLDRLNPLKTAFRIIMPLCRPGIAITALFVFVMSWNEFLYALLLTGNKAKTLPIAIAGLVTPHGTLWGQIAAVAVLTSVPVLLTAYLLQRYIVRGLTFGAVKG